MNLVDEANNKVDKYNHVENYKRQFSTAFEHNSVTVKFFLTIRVLLVCIFIEVFRKLKFIQISRA